MKRFHISGSMEGQVKDVEEPIMCVLFGDLLLCPFTSKDRGPDPVHPPSTRQEHMQAVLGRCMFIP